MQALAAALALVAASALTPGCRKTEEARTAQAPTAAPRGPVEPAGPPAPEVQAAVQGVLDSGRHPWLTWPEVPGVLPDLETLYAAEPDGLFWFAGESAHPALTGALDAIARCDAMGLVPADYDAALLAKRWEAIRTGTGAAPADRALFDVGLTVAGDAPPPVRPLGPRRPPPRRIRLRRDVEADRPGRGPAGRAGRGRPPRRGRSRRAAVPGLPAAREGPRRLPRARRGGRAGAGAGARRRAEEGGAGQALGRRSPLSPRGCAPSATCPRTPPRPGTAADGTPLYEGALVDAVKHFQRRHALEPDGVLGPGTIAALNVPAVHRVRQIELALERERWLPEMRKEPHVFVNVPLFRLWGYDPDRPDEPLRMNVVVGKTLGHETPIFIEPDGVRDLPALLEPAPEHHPLGDRAEGAAGPVLPRPAEHGDRGERRRGRPRPPRHPGEPRQGRRREALRPPEAGREELARPRQVHLPERRERLHARDARAVALRPRPARLQPRLHPARGPGPPRPVGAARLAGVDAGRGSTPRCTASGRPRST